MKTFKAAARLPRVLAATALAGAMLAGTATIGSFGAGDSGAFGPAAAEARPKASSYDWTDAELAELQEELNKLDIKGPTGLGSSPLRPGETAGKIADALGGDFDFAPGDKYVALGDSYTAMGSPWGSLGMITDPASAACVRSDDGLGPRVAELLDAELVNASCSGALPAHYWKAQTPTAGPQRDAVTPDTKLVTMTMGGNLMIPASMANPINCGTSILASNEACARSLRATGAVDQLKAIWADLKVKAPDAKLVAVGYLVHDLDQGLVPMYNDLVREAAEASGVLYVDPGRGMDLTGGLAGGWGIHPSMIGQAGAADSIAMALGRKPANGETPANSGPWVPIDPLPAAGIMAK